VNRLAPYEGWQPLRDEAKRLWVAFREKTQPTKVTRLAVRYINRLDMPSQSELKDYLRTSPEVSPELPQGLSGFFMQLTLPQPDIRGTLVLNEAGVPSGRPEVASVVLDIDLFREEDVGQSEEWIWDYLESLRRRKNEIFEACITDRLRELFQ
jgi:uncharacterized protein (TIGR04255 family)